MSKRTSIRIPDELYEYLTGRAKREQRTVSNLIVSLLTIAAKDTERNTNAIDRGEDRGNI
jgi:predicted DNA-binding protein